MPLGDEAFRRRAQSRVKNAGTRSKASAAAPINDDIVYFLDGVYLKAGRQKAALLVAIRVARTTTRWCRR